jgi:hypothetical protein
MKLYIFIAAFALAGILGSGQSLAQNAQVSAQMNQYERDLWENFRLRPGDKDPTTGCIIAPSLWNADRTLNTASVPPFEAYAECVKQHDIRAGTYGLTPKK